MTQYLSKDMAICRLIDQASNGKIFFVEFTKKDGSTRRMTARRGVAKGVKGTGMAYRPLSKGMLTVYDMDKAGFRLINLTRLKRFTVNGQKYVVC